MKSAQRTIRPLAPDPLRPEQALAWVPGSVAPFTSLWMVLQRFMLLNIPTKAALLRELGIGAMARAKSDVSTVRTPGLSSPELIQRLASILGESSSSFEYCTIDAYPESVRSLFHLHRRFCPECLSEGFHSVLFSLKGLQKCPHHGALLMTCRRCRRLERLGDLSTVVSHPGRCACGHWYLDTNAARNPKSDLHRTERLRSLSHYLMSIGDVVWFHMPGMINNVPQEFGRQLQFWTHTLGAAPPPKGWLDNQAVPFVEKSCSLHSTTMGCTQVTARELRRSAASASTDDAELTAIFKSIKRYLLRNVLKVQASQINALAMSEDRDQVARVLRSSPDAPKAWAFLLWWQACVRSVSLRDWFQRRRPVYLLGEALCSSTEGSPLSLSRSEVRWLEHHLFVSHLKMTWRLATHRDLMQVPQWGWSVASRTLHGQINAAPSWSHARAGDGHLYAWIDDGPLQWSCAVNRPHVQSTKGKRCRAHRRQEILRAAIAPCLWFNSMANEWKTGSGPVPMVELDFVERVLSLPEPEVFILVGVVNQAGERHFAARCLGIPIASLAPTTRGAINALKHAVNCHRSVLLA